MDTSLSAGRSNFSAAWDFAEKHMPAVRQVLANLPAGYFMDFATAEPRRDMEEATDLILQIQGGTMAVRVRSRKFYQKAVDHGFSLDWSIRAVCRGHNTEIDKLRAGFGDWYFYGYSEDDAGKLAAWFLIDLYRVREEGLLERGGWQISPNGDGTSGMYIPLVAVKKAGCLLDYDAGIIRF